MSLLLFAYCDRLEKNDERITKLNLANTYIDASSVGGLARSLKGNTALCDLNLRRNTIGGGGVRVLANALPHTRLARLVLSRNEITDEDISHLAQVLQTPNLMLRVLILSYNQITSVGAMSLSRSLKQPQKSLLTSLVLNGNDIGDEGAIALSEALTTNKSLVSLSLRKNNITNVGAVALTRGLEENESLLSLDLYLNPIRKTEPLETTFELMMEHNTTLQHISLWKQVPARIAYLLIGNMAGRKYVGDISLSQALWPHILLRTLFLKGEQTDLIYYLLREKPEIFQ